MNIQKEKETPQTRKAINMKKNTIEALYNYFVKNDDTIDLSTVVDEIRAEYEYAAAKAKMHNADYDAAKEVILPLIHDTPMTAKDIFAACADSLPEGFTAHKVQYGLRNYWADEVNKIENGKKAFLYQAK